MPTFGNTAAFGYNASIRNIIESQYFTCPEAGTADSIHAKLWCNQPWTALIKAALYRKSTMALVGSTITKRSYTWNAWNKFDFAIPKPTLLAGVEYYLAIWADGSGGDVKLYGDAQVGGEVLENAVTFGNWIDPLTGTIRDEKHSIYCTYNRKTTLQYTLH